MSNELTKADKYTGIKNLFAVNKQVIVDVMPPDTDMKRVVGGILMQIRKNPTLLQCTEQSLMICALTAATLGLETDPALNQFSLVPFGRSIQENGQWKKIKEAQAMIEYRGLIVLALRSGEVVQVNSYLVYENEIKQKLFMMEYGLDPKIIHTPSLPPSERGNIVGTYSVANFTDGTKKFHWMWLEEVYKRRDVSKAWQNDLKRRAEKKKIDPQYESPWTNWPEEMIKKTGIKGLMKTLQLSPIKSQIHRAIEIDNMAQIGQSQTALIGQEIEESGLNIEIPFSEHQHNESETATFNETDLGRSSEGGGPEQDNKESNAANTSQAKKESKKADEQLKAKKAEQKKEPEKKPIF
jgi:recombination protein RecT